MMQTVVPTIPNGFWFAIPENEQKQIFWRYLPRWLTSSNISSLEYFYVGETTFYDRTYFNDWAESDRLVNAAFDNVYLGHGLLRYIAQKTVDRTRSVERSHRK